MHPLIPFLRFWAAALCLAGFLQPDARAAGKAPENDPAALAIVDRLASFYQAATTFSVTASSEVLRTAGVDLQPKKASTLTLQKPDKLRADLKSGPSAVQLITDGKTLSALTLSSNEYRQTASPTNLAPLLQQISPGLDLLVAADPRAKIMEGVTKLSLVGDEKIDDVECVHLLFEQPDAVVDVFVQKGEQPVMRRFLLKTVDQKTLIQFDLTNWKIDPKVEPDIFVFTPPADARKVEATPPPSAPAAQQ